MIYRLIDCLAALRPRTVVLLGLALGVVWGYVLLNIGHWSEFLLGVYHHS